MNLFKLFHFNLLSNKEICLNNVDEMKTFCNNCIDISLIIKEFYYSKDRRAYNSLLEWYDLSRFLNKFHNSLQIQYPLYIIKLESPDFIISYKETRIGIEHTTGQTQKNAYATQQLLKSGSDSFLEIVPKLAEEGRPKKNEFDYLIKDKNTELDQPPTFGNALEYQWADVFINRIIEKTKKLNSNFSLENRNILLVSEKILRIANKTIKLKYLKDQYKMFVTRNKYKYYFDEIYVIADKWMEKTT